MAVKEKKEIASVKSKLYLFVLFTDAREISGRVQVHVETSLLSSKTKSFPSGRCFSLFSVMQNPSLHFSLYFLI